MEHDGTQKGAQGINGKSVKTINTVSPLLVFWGLGACLEEMILRSLSFTLKFSLYLHIPAVFIFRKNPFPCLHLPAGDVF